MRPRKRDRLLPGGSRRSGIRVRELSQINERAGPGA